MPGLITIASFRDVTAASLARMRLEGSGVWCHLSNTQTSVLEPAVVGSALQVHEADVERALAILNEEPEADEADLERHPEDGPGCPLCKKQYAYAEREAWSVIASRLTFGRVAVRARMRCRSCSHSWAPHPDAKRGPYR